MFCASCGKQIPSEARFCANCGTAQAPVQSAEGSSQPKAPSTETLQTSLTRNPNAGCGKAFLWVGGIMLALIASCAIIGYTANQATEHSRGGGKNAAQNSADKYEKWLDSSSLNRLTDSINGVNSKYGEKLFQSASLGQYRCGAVVDGNLYEALSNQDKRIITQIVGTACVGAYRAPFGPQKGNVRRLPDGGLSIHITDESGDEVASDLWTRK